MKYKFIITILIGFCLVNSYAQDFTENINTPETRFVPKNDSVAKNKTHFFIGYDFGEAIFNQFRSLGSEMGIRRSNDHLVRLAYTHLWLTEEHLSSDFAQAVDGENVEGKQMGLELFYDFSILVKGLYLAPSVGYYGNEYTHTVTKEMFQKSSFTLGAAISFTEVNIFKLNGLYYRLSIPLRYTLNPIEETTLGDATIKSNQFDNSIWFFVGYQF